MEMQKGKIYQVAQCLGSVTNIIRGLGQMAEKPILWLTSVDDLPDKGFRDFSSSLLQQIINNLGVKNYPTKNRCRILTSPRFQRAVLPIS